jgi:hypothetical protein
MRFLRCLLALTAVSSAHALTIDLKPDGPVSTLAAARDAARAARAAGSKEAIVVRIADGVYPLSEAVVFEPQDSGVTYEAAPGARPIIMGGKRITGFQPGEKGVWSVHVDPAWRFEALWINGRRATRARTPNEGYFQAAGQPTQALPGVPLKGSPETTMLQVSPQDAASLRGLSAEELKDVNVCVNFNWDMERYHLAGVRPEDGTLQFTGGRRAFFSLAPFQALCFENYRAALDAPGEWFLARDGTLSYIPRPGEEMKSAEVWAPKAMQWLVFKGDAVKKQFVENLRFSGLSFRFQNYALPPEGAHFGQAESGLGAAIEADGARDLAFESCEFEHTLTNVAWFRRGCHDIMMRHCLLTDLGGGGVKIGDPKVALAGPEQSDHVSVEDSIIHSGGRYFLGSIGVTIFHASDCTIRHCDIGDFYYTAISIGWTWGYKPTAGGRNLVEDCNLHHLGWAVLSDMGAVYTLGPQLGTVIRGCNMHDIGCASYGGWGMYNDEGSTGVVWENNLVHHTQDAGYHQHYGRGNIIRNNIFAFGAEEEVRRSKTEEYFAFAFERNIVLLGEGRLFMQLDKNWDDGRVFLADNVYWRPHGTIPDFAGKSWADWQFMGRDVTSVVADPLFVDPEKGDWTLQPESPALKLGFVPFDWKKAGVIGDAAWRQLAAEEFPPMKYGIKPKPLPMRLSEGFESTPIGAKPGRPAQVHGKKPGIVAVVADHPSKGARCLQLSDGPDVEPAYEPHFYYNPNHERGLTRVAFDVRTEPDYVLVHEWRDDSQPYRTGPMLIFEKGAVRANGKKLTDLPPNEWVHVEVTARIGEDSDAKWNCAITLPGKEPQHFDGLKFEKPDMKELKWLGFSSPGKAVAKCWLDEIEIENHPVK